MTTPPFGAMPQDTGEFMLGKIAVTPVFLESNGQLDASTENWTSGQIETTLQTIQTGLDWWVDMLAAQHSVHRLEFTIDATYARQPVSTRYEPISRPSNDYALWVQEFIDGVGKDTPGGLEADMRAFNDAQRQKMGADWAYTMFIVNSQHDADGAFAAGGSFPLAFAFAGGLFLVSPSTRPASTFAHETGHMFWAKDEYPGGSTWSDRRGYYNTQNTNAADNPTPGFVQQPSIMASGKLLDTAFANHVSPASTLAMIGWQDSDHDGVFDVLDVPLKLNGTGYYDGSAGAYQFHGAAKVGLLPNLNSEGLGNDITLNRVSSIEYRIDGGSWTTALQPDAYQTDFDLSIPLALTAKVIEIRAIDAPTGVSSNIFQGRVSRADAVTSPGINGFVWTDANANGVREVGEVGSAGWSVDVLSNTGQPLSLRHVVEPDALPDGTLASGSVPDVQITATGNDTDGRVGVFGDAAGSSSKTFRVYSRAMQSWTANWTDSTRLMRVDFGAPTSLVEIDAIGAAADSYGRLEAFDAAGNLLGRFTTPKLSEGQVVTMRVESAVGAIAWVHVGGHAKTSVRLDNLRFGPLTHVTTQLAGQFSMPDLPRGQYLVKVTSPNAGFSPPVNGGNQQLATVTAGGVTNDVDFAFQTGSRWQNPTNYLDVNNDHQVSALDVLLIINEINQNGPHLLAPVSFAPPPFIDVNGDATTSALDALLIVNFINSLGSGESEGAVAPVPAASSVSPGGAGPAATGIPATGLPATGPATNDAGVPTAAASVACAGLLHDEALLAMPDLMEGLSYGPSLTRRSTRPALRDAS